MPKKALVGEAIGTPVNFEAKFRQAFGREMTPEERWYFGLSSILLNDDDEASETNGTAAGSES